MATGTVFWSPDEMAEGTLHPMWCSPEAQEEPFPEEVGTGEERRKMSCVQRRRSRRESWPGKGVLVI